MAQGLPSPQLQPHTHPHRQRQRQHLSQPLLPAHLQHLLGVLVGACLAYGLTRHLAALPSTFLTALLLAGGSVLSGRKLTPWLWWVVLGASCGGLLGSAMVVGQKIQGSHPHEGLALRLGIVASLMVAGAVGGGSLSRDANHPDRRPPKDTLRSASALCTGIFAVVVTLTFLHSGLDQARTVSSRLSTALTILVMALTGPGWLVHLLGSSWWGKGEGGRR
jgi:hypothetical protein